LLEEAMKKVFKHLPTDLDPLNNHILKKMQM
jgi:hypothetical protein